MCNYRGALEFLSTNGYVQSKVFLSFERGLTSKMQGCHFILQVKFYTGPTKDKTILLIADSEKNSK